MGRFAGQLKTEKAALAVCLLLALAGWAVFGQTLQHEFVNYDDGQYVYDHPMVSKGITLEGARWLITHQQEGNWHPLTSLSHMLDVELYGLNPAGHHLTSVLLHIATAIALFLVLRSMTGALWRSAFVAAVFAIHPLRVESVAWISERKDVLSGLFFMLTLGAYAHYARRPFSMRRYVPVCLLFILGLMSKPMLVTLPFVLLLLDVWPLGRTRFASPHQPSTDNAQPLLRLVAEKIPLLLISALFCRIAVWAQDDAGAVMQMETISLPWRFGNALCSYATYIRQTFLPTGLVLYYPHQGADLPLWRIAGSTLLLILIALAALLQWKKRPYLPVGWLWYTGMLVPVIGIMQVGGQAHADRYTYLPQIGLCLMITWLVADGCSAIRYRRTVLSITSVVMLTVLAAMASMQTKHWRDSSSLWNHSLAHTENNYVALGNVGHIMESQGEYDEAIGYFREALEILPYSAEAHYNLGVVLVKNGEHQTAIEHFQTALNIRPDYAEVHNSLGVALTQQGKPEAAVVHFQTALKVKPGFADAHLNLGSTLAVLGRYDDALEHFQSALQINPTLAEAHFGMGDLYLMQGKMERAMRQYQAALNLKPDFPEPMNNLAWLLATAPDANLRDGQRAVALALSAVALTRGENSSYLDTLSAAYAEAGQYAEAIAAAHRALDALPEGETSDTIPARIKLYESGRPYHMDQ